MMSLSSISSYTSIDTLVAQYMAIERQPIQLLEQQKTEYQNIKSVFNELKSKLTALRSIATDFKTAGQNSKFGIRTVTSTDESILTASANGEAVNGSHLVYVSQLAKADTIVSNQFNSSGTTIETTEGSGLKSFQITINGGTTTIDVEIEAGDGNSEILSKIAAAINNSDAAVTASVIADSQNTNKLILRSDSTGSAYGISLTDVTGSLLNAVGLNDSVEATDTTGGYIYEDSELNAILEIDGVQISNNSNVIENILTGVTLNLKGTQEISDDPIQFTIEPDKETIKENVEEFFTKYNEVINYIKEQMNVNPESQSRGVLAGDSTFINLRMNLRTILSSAISTVQSGNPSLLAEVGIEPDDNGNLSIDNLDDFYDALDENVARVEDLFNSTNGIANQIYNLLTPFTRTGGIIDDNSDTLDNRIDSIENRIDSIEKRLEWREQNYRDQFTKLEEAYVALGMQQSLLQMISNSLY